MRGREMGGLAMIVSRRRLLGPDIEIELVHGV